VYDARLEPTFGLSCVNPAFAKNRRRRLKQKGGRLLINLAVPIILQLSSLVLKDTNYISRSM
jgi:hypothetical protein